MCLRWGESGGLDQVGVAPADIFLQARAALIERKSRGLHDTMEFTYRNPERSTDPRMALPDAKAVIVGAYSYSQSLTQAPSTPSSRIARYAQRDYYAELELGLNAMRDKLRDEGWKAVVFADDNSLVDRGAAHLAGLGWFGKNANLLLKGHGSFFVLGSVVTNAPLRASTTQVDDGCGACKRCVDACPTGAIVENGVVDAAKCLAWLIQKPGVFDRQYRVALADRIYGCDDCQEVCPPTQRLSITKKQNAEVRQWVPIIAIAQHGRCCALKQFQTLVHHRSRPDMGEAQRSHQLGQHRGWLGSRCPKCTCSVSQPPTTGVACTCGLVCRTTKPSTPHQFCG